MGPRHTRRVRIVSTAMGVQARACEAWVERDMEYTFPFYPFSLWERAGVRVPSV
jgi:hypothetical protein